jgi:hypothetical protein
MDPITSDLYQEGQTQGIPAEALRVVRCGIRRRWRRCRLVRRCSTSAPAEASTCCCRHNAWTDRQAYGLDMTDETLALARENQRRSGLTNEVPAR